MRRTLLLTSVLVSVGFLASACEFSTGDVDGIGGFDGFGGSGDGDGDGGGAGGAVGDGDGDGRVVKFFQPPENFHVPLPEVVRTAGYSSDSAELRIRDAYRAVKEIVYEDFATCALATVGEQGNNKIGFDVYGEFCQLACLSQYAGNECGDADEWVCLSGLGYSDDVQSCFDECAVFACEDGSGDTPLRCDGFADCDDLSDEKDCGDFSFVCKTVPQAVSGFAVCDGEEDCSDGSDESDCGTEGFVCEDGERIPAANQCDGSVDCTGGEDEAECEELLFDCGDGTSIPWFMMCDEIPDCSDGSDEDGAIVSCSSFDDQLCEL